MVACTSRRRQTKDATETRRTSKLTMEAGEGARATDATHEESKGEEMHDAPERSAPASGHDRRSRPASGAAKGGAAKGGKAPGHGKRVDHSRGTVMINGQYFAKPCRPKGAKKKKSAPKFDASKAYGSHSSILNPPKLFRKR